MRKSLVSSLIAAEDISILSGSDHLRNGLILDLTVRFESHEGQPEDVNSEKREKKI